MLQIAYVSTATRLMRAAELSELLEQSRAFNAAHDITGMLLYKDGSFLQVIEGAADVLQPLYARICHDHRHTRVKTLIEVPVAEREFPDWSMAFHDLDGINLKALPGYSDFMERGETARSLFEDLTRAKKLLLVFRAKS